MTKVVSLEEALPRVQEHAGKALDCIRADDPLEAREEVIRATFWLDAARETVGEYAVEREVAEAMGG
jgi:hypothetical protein